MSTYALPILETPKTVAENEVLLIASGDLRQSANKVCWPAQAEMEKKLTAAFKPKASSLRRAHPYREDLGHGFIYNQRMGMDVFAKSIRSTAGCGGGGVAIQQSCACWTGEPSWPHPDRRELVWAMAGIGRHAESEWMPA